MKIKTNKIEFWIILFFVIRLIGIINPPLETGHSWRQVTGLMVARNFLEVNSNILYPRIDETQGLEGIIGMEFPLLNYLHYLVSLLFGYTHWYGRLINLSISSIGIFYYSKIIGKFFSKKIALAATLFLLSSIWFMFSRKMMPDTFCISLMFIGLYSGEKYLEKGKGINLVAYILFSSLAILSKIPAGIYFALLLPLVWSNKYLLKNKILIAIVTIIPMLLTYLWYFWWNPNLSAEYGIWYNSGKSITTGFHELISHPYYTFKNFYFNAFHSYILFGIFVVGLVLAIRNKEKTIISIFLILGLVFFIYMMKSGFFFYHHSYYIVPFVPIMALIAGYGISLINNKKVYISLMVLGVGEAILNQHHDFFIKETSKYNMTLEQVADQVTNRDDLITINGGGNPLQLYLSHRKGWTCENDQIKDVAYLKKIQKRGCKYVIIDNNKLADFNKTKPLFSDKNFSIYAIEQIIH